MGFFVWRLNFLARVPNLLKFFETFCFYLFINLFIYLFFLFYKLIISLVLFLEYQYLKFFTPKDFIIKNNCWKRHDLWVSFVKPTRSLSKAQLNISAWIFLRKYYSFQSLTILAKSTTVDARLARQWNLQQT